MKITVWQQFSSNHSSHFTIVGVFNTLAVAENAAAEIKGILQKIQQWHEDNPEKSEALYEEADGEWPPPLSEIEKELAKQYNVRWPGGIDWFKDARIRIILDHLVLIDTEFQTDWGPQPFDEIINRLGGYGLVTGSDIGGDYFGKIIVSVHCNAPDPQAANDIVEEKTTEWETETVRNYEKLLHFQWDYDEGMWELEDLIQYLKERHCTSIEYTFHGTHYTRTENYPVND